MSGRLAGKVAVITGAASGIGLRTAQRFAEEGAKVLLTDIQNDKGAEAARALGSNAVYQHCDVSRESDIQAAIDAAVARHGRLDVLLSNAGVGGNRAPIEELDIEAWDRLQAIVVCAFAMEAIPAVLTFLNLPRWPIEQRARQNDDSSTGARPPLDGRIARWHAGSVTDLATAYATNSRYVARHLPLACLSPGIVDAILEGRQNATLAAGSHTELRTWDLLNRIDVPLDWELQKSALGLR